MSFFVIEIVLFILAITFAEVKFSFFSVLLKILSFVFALWVISRDYYPEMKIMWIFIILLLPYLGCPLFLVSYFREKKRRNRSFELKEYKGSLEVFDSTNDALLSLSKDIESAKKLVLLEYFVIAPGYVWSKLLPILIDKAKSGIRVEIIYDDVGSLLSLPYPLRLEMKKCGIKCTPFGRLFPLSLPSLYGRDHRKLAVIDRKIAYVGSMNLSDKYLNLGRTKYKVKDFVARVKGDAAEGFICDGSEGRGVRAEGDRIIPFMSSPGSNESLPIDLLRKYTNDSSDYLWITTPYLIPGSELSSYLGALVKRGVDVRIITPGRGDRFFVHALTRSSYKSLLDKGIKIFEYSEGFLHSKSFVCDGRYSALGSVNLDLRSLYSAYECGAVSVSDDMQIKREFDRLFEKSKEIKKGDKYISFSEKVTAFFLKPFEPLM